MHEWLAAAGFVCAFGNGHDENREACQRARDSILRQTWLGYHKLGFIPRTKTSISKGKLPRQRGRTHHGCIVAQFGFYELKFVF